MPKYNFTDANKYAYDEGMVYLGRDPKTGRDIGIKIEKHGIVVATTRHGKGAGFIVPNLNRWQDSTVTIDPKGENFAQTWRNRMQRDQTIALIDPFGETFKLCIPEWPRERFKTSFNPMEGIGPNTPRARERLKAIANALTVVHDPKHMEWVDGCRSIIAGCCAFTVATVEPKFRHLGTVRDLLKQDADTLQDIAVKMMACNACGGLASAAGGIILDALSSDRGLPPQFLQKAKAVTEWLDSPELSSCLISSDFSLSDLTDNNLSVYIVLNADDLEEYSGFMRLFIQSMLYGITQQGIGQKTNCLFILDEFYSLGKFDKIAEVMGRMAGYGVHVVPIIQNIGQLEKLYGKETTGTFFGNAEFQMFFGGDDEETVKYQTEKIGSYTISEVQITKPIEPVIRDGKPINNRSAIAKNPDGTSKEERHGFLWLKKRFVWTTVDEVQLMREYREKMTEYHASMAWAGKPRLPPSEIASLTGKGIGDTVSRSMIVFAKAGDVLNLKLAPFFQDNDYVPIEELKKAEEEYIEKRREKLAKEAAEEAERKEIQEIMEAKQFAKDLQAAMDHKGKNFCVRLASGNTDFLREAEIQQALVDIERLRGQPFSLPANAQVLDLDKMH